MSPNRSEAVPELKPCPFCGSVPSVVTRNVEPQGDPWYGRKDETFVLCDCGACLFDGSFHEGFWDAETRAAAAWNRRASPPPPSPEGGEGARLPFAILDEELAALRRFYETCEDSQPYDVPKQMMKQLAVIGLVRRVTAAIYEITTFGLCVINGDFAALRPEGKEEQSNG